MCFGSASSYKSTVTKTELPPAPAMQAPAALQATPAPARTQDVLSYKKKGKRGLTIPRTSGVNVPGA